MLKKTIKFEDFDGEEVEQDFYFNMSKAELIELTASLPTRNVQTYLTQLAESNDQAALLAFIKDVIARAYGENHNDRFVKNSDYTSSFLASEAYSELLFSMTDLAVASGFINGIMPRSIQKMVAEEIKKQGIKLPTESEPESKPEAKSEPVVGVISEPKKTNEMTLEELKAELERRGASE